MYTIILILFIFIVFIISFPIKVYFKYWNKNLSIKILNKKISIDRHVIIEKEDRLTENIKSKTEDKFPEHKFYIKSIKHMWIFLKNNKFKPSIKLKLNLIYGLNDAAATAMLYGLIYSLYPILQYFISQCFNLKDIDFKLNPQFNKEVFYFEGESIISLSLVKIIYIGLNLFITIKKSKKNISAKLG